MTTISEKTATQQSMIDDIADTAIGTGYWSEGDADFDNSASDGNWWNNARVIQNNATGEYLLFYPESLSRIGYRNDYETGNANGIRIIRSSGWTKDTSNFSDGAPGAPDGNTTVQNRDSITGDVPSEDRRQQSFATVSASNGESNDQASGLWHGQQNATSSVRYFGSVGQHYISLAAWSDEDVRADGNGQSSFYVYENVQNQFFAHLPAGRRRVEAPLPECPSTKMLKILHGWFLKRLHGTH